MIAEFDGLSLEWLRAKPGIKWAVAEPGELAAWVADMDYPVPEVVARAIVDTLADGDLGYPDLRGGPRLADPFVDRMRARYGVDIDSGRIREFDDVLNAIQAVLSVTVPRGGRVAIHTPTYPPFLDTFARMGHVVEPIPFVRTDRGWVFDLDAAAESVARSDVAIIVNPHNPTGRVLTPHELTPLVEAARASGTLLVADEVHADLVYEEPGHTPLAALDPDSVTITSATKAFNLAGIRCAVAHIGSSRVWAALESGPPHLYGAVSNLSVAATQAAWSPAGDSWLDELRAILRRNRDMVMAGLSEDFIVVPPEATYLAWIDVSHTGLGADPAGAVRERTGLIVSPGADFGPAGTGFVRLNFATGSAVLEEALDRLNRSAEPR